MVSELEKQVLSEKAKGLSDLEVAAKLLLYERAVRSIVRKSMAHQSDEGKVVLRPPMQAFGFPGSPIGDAVRVQASAEDGGEEDSG